MDKTMLVTILRFFLKKVVTTFFAPNVDSIKN